MSIEPDYEFTASSILEYLLTKHPYSREVADLPDAEIERLRNMLREAVNQRIEPQKIFDAMARGFERSWGDETSSLSPPLASDLHAAKSKEDALVALVRVLEGTA